MRRGSSMTFHAHRLWVGTVMRSMMGVISHLPG